MEKMLKTKRFWLDVGVGAAAGAFFIAFANPPMWAFVLGSVAIGGVYGMIRHGIRETSS